MSHSPGGEIVAVGECARRLVAQHVDDHRPVLVQHAEGGELGGIFHLIGEPRLQPLSRRCIQRFVLEPFGCAEQDRIRGAKGQLGMLDQRAGEIGRIHPRIGNDLGIARDDAGDFETDEQGTGQRDEPDDAPRREDVCGSDAGPPGFHPCLHAEHSRRPAQFLRKPAVTRCFQGRFQRLKKSRGCLGATQISPWNDGLACSMIVGWAIRHRQRARRPFCFAYA